MRGGPQPRTADSGKRFPSCVVAVIDFLVPWGDQRARERHAAEGYDTCCRLPPATHVPVPA
jgi:hypothetical protein